jgi:hypothetical protein
MRALPLFEKNIWDYKQDAAWHDKKYMAGNLLAQYVHYFYLFSKDDEGRQSFFNAKDQPDFDLLSFCEEPVFPADPEIRLNNPEYLSTIFCQFLGRYSPPKDTYLLLEHLMAMQMYYTEIGHHVKSEPLGAPARIDLALTTLSGTVRSIISKEKDHLEEYYPRVKKLNRDRMKGVPEQNQRALDLYFTLDSRRRESLKENPYTGAKKYIIKLWKGPGWDGKTDPLSDEGIVKLYRKEGLIPGPKKRKSTIGKKTGRKTGS